MSAPPPIPTSLPPSTLARASPSASSSTPLAPIVSTICVAKTPPSVVDSGQKRNLTWGDYFQWADAQDIIQPLCQNITTNPVSLTLAFGQPYYFLSGKLPAKEYKNQLRDDWLNLVVGAMPGPNCKNVPVSSDECVVRFNSIFSGCPADDNWTMGGMVQDQCTEFYMTSGSQITGHLVDFPIFDMYMYPGSQYWPE